MNARKWLDEHDEFVEALWRKRGEKMTSIEDASFALALTSFTGREIGEIPVKKWRARHGHVKFHRSPKVKPAPLLSGIEGHPMCTTTFEPEEPPNLFDMPSRSFHLPPGRISIEATETGILITHEATA